MAGFFMYQTVRDLHITVAEHLEAEWQLFRSFETGATGYLCRTWETARPAVVLGRNGSVADDVIQDACRRDGVPVLRRFSGGGTVILGPGCLNYALAVSLVSYPAFEDVAASFSTILQQVAALLNVTGLAVAGVTDLALDGRKVSGNAQRRGRRALLHHGTLLYAFDAGLAARYLRDPDRQPAYRAVRPHTAFLGNLPLSRPVIEAGLRLWRPAREISAQRPSGLARARATRRGSPPER
jgi:lipoate-protein ligase A